jgi:hypothetical protein
MHNLVKQMKITGVSSVKLGVGSKVSGKDYGCIS